MESEDADSEKSGDKSDTSPTKDEIDTSKSCIESPNTSTSSNNSVTPKASCSKDKDENFSNEESSSSSTTTAATTTTMDKEQNTDWVETLQSTVTSLISTLQHKKCQEDSA